MPASKRNTGVQVPPTLSQSEALLYEVDWRGDEWIEVVLSYLEAFRPGEPVALVLITPSIPGAPSEEEIQQRLLQIILPSGRETFPDIALVQGIEHLAETLGEYDDFQVLPRGTWFPKDLPGPNGLRLAHSRELRRPART